MGILVIALWLLWMCFLCFHITKPGVLPLRFRILSFYVPVVFTVYYAFTVEPWLGVLAAVAALISIGEEYYSREDMS